MKNYNQMANDVLRRIEEQNALLEEKRENRRKAAPKVIAASLGCVCVVAILGVVAWQTGLISFNKGVYIPRAEIAVEQSAVSNGEKYKYDSNELPDKMYESHESSKEVEPYIEYEGRIYRQYYESGPVGSECLGKVNDGTSGVTGTVEGDVYPVEGMDPEFMLCVEIDDERYNKNDVPGPFHYYINDNDITLRTGEDWFGDKYNLKENVSGGRYEYYYESFSESACNPSYGTPLRSEQVDEIIDVVYDSSFVYLTEEIESLVKKSAMYEIDFRLNDSTEVHMMLCRAGYVLLDNFSDVCIKLDRPVMEDFFNQKNGGVGLK